MDKQRSDLEQYLEMAEKRELEFIGIEADVDNGAEMTEADVPYEVHNIRVYQKMITVFQIEHWISGGKLNLSPEYQRKLVWDEQRKSALIESLLLRIPIPAVYLDENGEGIKDVIDGTQRLSTIHSFLKNEFSLKKMQYLVNCEKKYFRDLEPKLRTRIEDTELTVNILDERCPQLVKFDVFRRLNTGGLPLNFQEIRNIMATPAVRLLLKRMAESGEFQKATQKLVKDVRMGAQELCLRYLAILNMYDWKTGDFYQYSGLMKMMDRMILFLNEKKEQELEILLQKFKKAMGDCHEILKDYSFCKPGNKKINKSLFTGWAVVLTNIQPKEENVKRAAPRIREAYRRRLEEDADFYSAITSSTGTRSHILLSINVIRKLWEECHDKGC